MEGKISCFHCGDPCQTTDISYEDKWFCCMGCKTVYQILNEHGLCTYYNLNPGAGNKIKGIEPSKFDFLDSAEIQDKLLDFKSSDHQKITFNVPSIHCSSCIWLLENLPNIEPAIMSSKVNFGKKTLSLDFNPNKITLKQVAELLGKLGYTPLISLDTISPAQVASSKDVYIKIGVAGFCFGNIMLLSFPDYLGMEIEEELSSYFSYLSFVLSLPVLVYSSQDYFRSALLGIKTGFSNIDIPIALGIVALFVRSCYEVFTATGPGYFDSLSGLVFFLLIGKWVQGKAYDGLSFDRDYKSYFPLAVLKKQHDTYESTPVYKLRVEDLVLIRNAEIIPSDAILRSPVASIDYSFVTGEAIPVYTYQGDKIYAGGRLIGKSAVFEVTKAVSQSYLTQLWNDVDSMNRKKKGSSQSIIGKVSRYFTIAILTIALLSAVFWSFSDVRQAFLVFSAVLIVACPCALALASPFTLSATMNVFGENKFYLKNTHVIERLWKISTIVFDKTGTLTTNNQKEVGYNGTGLCEKDKTAIKSIVLNSSHPYSQAIYQYLNHADEKVPEPILFSEAHGRGVTGIVGERQIKLGTSGFAGVPPTQSIHHAEDGGKVYVSIDEEPKGYFNIQNNYRSGLKELVSKLSKTFRLGVISGDNESEKKLLQGIFPSARQILFRQKPDDKVDYVKSCQERGEKVLMLGDGLNDAAALRQSDVGVAVADDKAAFTPASDAIILGGQITSLDKFLRLAKSSRKIIIASIVISFLYNLIGLSFAIMGKLTPILAAILMPLSSISVVVFATMAVRMVSKLYKFN
ncbi:MAG: heavy metal translocating P-type ATPase metal-binding domain-containing protein [Cyclobacteriaceae bacterium]